MSKGKMETWNVYIAGKFFCSVNAYTRKSARLQAKRMPNLRGGEIYVTRAKVLLHDPTAKLVSNGIDWGAPDHLGQWGDTGA
jgi:hypothetical protein